MPDLILYHLPSHRANNEVVILLPVCWDRYHHHLWTSDVLHPSLRCQLQVELHSYHLLEFVMPPVIIWCCESTSVSWYHLVLQVSFEKLAVLMSCLFYIHRCVTLLQAVAWHAPVYCWVSMHPPTSGHWWSAAGEDCVPRQRHPVATSCTCRHLLPCPELRCHLVQISTHLLSGEVILLGLSSLSLDHYLLMR